MTSHKFTSISEASALYRWCKYLCARSGISVEFFEPTPATPSPYTTETCIYIPYVTTMTIEAEQDIRFFVLHEAGGHQGVGPEVFDILKRELGSNMKHPLATINNIIEDYRIERVLCRAYRGDRQVIDAGRGRMLQDEINGAREACDKFSLTGKDLTDNSANMCGLSSEVRFAMGEYLPSVADLAPDLWSALTPKTADVCRRLQEFDLESKLNALTDCEGAWTLSEDVYRLLWNKSPEEVDKEKQQARADAEEFESEETKEGTPSEAGGVVIKWNKLTLHDHKRDGSPMRSTIDFTDFEASSWTPYPPDKVKFKRPTGRAITGKGTKDAPSRAFVNKVRNWLQAKTQAAWDGGHKQGSLRSGALWRGGVPVEGNGAWQQRVFRKPSEGAELDASVLLLVDFSGSMSGTKIDCAISAAVHLAEVCRGLQVPACVIGFTEAGDVLLFDFKRFNERLSTEQLTENLQRGKGELCGNADADAVLFALHKLETEVETKRKLLIVLSDGCPADAHGGDPATGLLKVVGEIQDRFKAKTSNVEIFGIGILDDNVTRFYKNNVVIHKLQDLEPTLLSVIKNNLLSY